MRGLCHFCYRSNMIVEFSNQKLLICSYCKLKKLDNATSESLPRRGNTKQWGGQTNNG